jgi:hypothetical protein
MAKLAVDQRRGTRGVGWRKVTNAQPAPRRLQEGFLGEDFQMTEWREKTDDELAHIGWAAVVAMQDAELCRKGHQDLIAIGRAVCSAVGDTHNMQKLLAAFHVRDK